MAVHMSVCECVCVGVSLHWDFVTATDKSSPHSTSEQGHVVWGMDVSSDRENTDRKRSKKKKKKNRDGTTTGRTFSVTYTVKTPIVL